MKDAAPANPGRGPVPNPVASFWTKESRPLDNHRSSPDLPATADIVIIGAGLAGIATAYHVLKDDPGSNPPSIVLVEAREVSSGATGRNGGHVKPDTYYNVSKYGRLYGSQAAAELAAFEVANVLAVKDLVEKEKIDCDFHLTRAVDVYLDAGHARDTEAAYRQLAEAGNVDLSDVAFTPKRDAERISGVKGAQCCFSFTAAHLWPLKLAHHLVELLLEQGLNLQANTPVTSVTAATTSSSSPSPLPCSPFSPSSSSTSSSTSQWNVNTTRGSITTTNVVYATNGYTAHVLPEYADTIVPVRGVACRIEAPGGTSSPYLVNTYGIRFDPRNYDYLIPRADGSIVVGGARQRFWHNRGRWFDNVRDDELVDEAGLYFDGYMQRHFHGWEDSGAKTTDIWTGIMGYSADFMPHLGAVPDKPGQFIIAGFSGHGMPEILLSSKGVASMVRDGDEFEATGLPRVFKTSKGRVEARSSLLEESLKSLWEKPPKSARL